MLLITLWDVPVECVWLLLSSSNWLCSWACPLHVCPAPCGCPWFPRQLRGFSGNLQPGGWERRLCYWCREWSLFQAPGLGWMEQEPPAGHLLPVGDSMMGSYPQGWATVGLSGPLSGEFQWGSTTLSLKLRSPSNRQGWAGAG